MGITSERLDHTSRCIIVRTLYRGWKWARSCLEDATSLLAGHSNFISQKSVSTVLKMSTVHFWLAHPKAQMVHHGEACVWFLVALLKEGTTNQAGNEATTHMKRTSYNRDELILVILGTIDLDLVTFFFPGRM